MLARVTAPMTFLRAARGLLDGDPFYPDDLVAEVADAGRLVEARTVAGTNHYSLVMGRDGAAPVARAVTDALDAVAR
jgi:hypothetical protein